MRGWWDRIVAQRAPHVSNSKLYLTPVGPLELLLRPLGLQPPASSNRSEFHHD